MKKPSKFKILDLQAEDVISVNFGLEIGLDQRQTTKFSTLI